MCSVWKITDVKYNGPICHALPVALMAAASLLVCFATEGELE